MIDPIIAMTVQLAIGTLFVAAAWHKLRDWPRIAGVVAAYRILPDRANLPASAMLIILELSVAVGSLIAPGALLGAAVLLLAYALAIGFNIVRGNDRIDCGCIAYGIAGPRLAWAMVIRNTVIALVAILVSALSLPTRSIVWVDFLSVAFAFAVSCILYATLDSKLALPRTGARA
ncbi:MAG: MauE/DoxX family redox-associated membrane protein [Myxococcota bacterium]|jgi:hypothetical protein